MKININFIRLCLRQKRPISWASLQGCHLSLSHQLQFPTQYQFAALIIFGLPSLLFVQQQNAAKTILLLEWPPISTQFTSPNCIDFTSIAPNLKSLHGLHPRHFMIWFACLVWHELTLHYCRGENPENACKHKAQHKRLFRWSTFSCKSNSFWPFHWCPVVHSILLVHVLSLVGRIAPAAVPFCWLCGMLSVSSLDSDQTLGDTAMALSHRASPSRTSAFY